jgi:hypothetical protein
VFSKQRSRADRPDRNSSFFNRARKLGGFNQSIQESKYDGGSQQQDGNKRQPPPQQAGPAQQAGPVGPAAPAAPPAAPAAPAAPVVNEYKVSEEGAEAFFENSTEGTDDLPLRPEFRRAGIDSLIWPNDQQIQGKLLEQLRYRPIHEGRGNMYNNPLIKQNVLEAELRFRNTDPFPRVPRRAGLPNKAQSERFEMLIQNTYNNREVKLNPVAATPVFISQNMQSIQNELNVPMMDAYVTPGILAGGPAFVHGVKFNSLT